MLVCRHACSGVSRQDIFLQNAEHVLQPSHFQLSNGQTGYGTNGFPRQLALGVVRS